MKASKADFFCQSVLHILGDFFTFAPQETNESKFSISVESIANRQGTLTSRINTVLYIIRGG